MDHSDAVWRQFLGFGEGFVPEGELWGASGHFSSVVAARAQN